MAATPACVRAQESSGLEVWVEMRLSGAGAAQGRMRSTAPDERSLGTWDGINI